MNTIAGISTGNTSAGVSIIRLSGDDCLTIAKRIVPKTLDWEPRHMYLTRITDGEISDMGLVVYFKAPISFTGEDIVEFHLHGGMTLSRHFLEALLERGAVLAEPGEFSRRAFMNGKSSVDSLEGIVDLINAQSEAELKAGYNLLIGSLKQKTDTIQAKLTDTIASIDVALDYPEEDIEYSTTQAITTELKGILNEIDTLIDSSKTGLIISGGINVAIVGKPNVGKSSILNALLSFDRAIVTDVAGTTRDTLQESYTYKGIKVNLIDTAGIRESNDFVEKIGIERSKQALDSCHIVLLVIDSTRGLEEEDMRIIDMCKAHSQPIVIAINKTDIGNDVDLLQEQLSALLKNATILLTSVNSIQSINQLKDTLKDLAIDDDINANALMITNTRHLNCLKEAHINLNEALNAINNISLDCVSVHLRQAWQNMGEITGKYITDEVLDSIFSKFCLGK